MIKEIKIDRLEELIRELMKKIDDTYPTESAEGNPIEIDNAAAAPLVKCVTAIIGSQSGSGTPSPENIRPLVAYSSGSVEVEDEDGNSTTYSTTFPSEIYKGSEDYVDGKVTAEWLVADLGDINWLYDSGGARFRGVLTNLKQMPVRTLPFICSCYQAITDGRAIANVPDGSCYNGTNEIYIFVHDSRYTDVDLFKAAVTGQKVAYPLQSPTTSSVTVSNVPVSSVHGYNKIESSTGNMEIEYVREHFQGIVNLIPEIKVNPSGDATATLSKMEVNGVIYGLPDIPEVKVNPSGEATATLSKLEVDDVIYGLPE